MVLLNKFIIKLLIIISFYNIFSILVITFSPKIEGYFLKTVNYLPYKHSIFFLKPLNFSREDVEINNRESQKLFKLINATENKSALDYKYWETKLIYQINNNSDSVQFEKDFINLYVLTKNNHRKNKSLKLFYLRNVPRFSNEVRDIVMAVK